MKKYKQLKKLGKKSLHILFNRLYNNTKDYVQMSANRAKVCKDLRNLNLF